MNKLEIMRQKSIDILLEELIKHQPGITSTRLWETAKDWYGKVSSRASVLEFEQALGKLRVTYRCTNKQWYPPNHVASPKLSGPKKDDPRQTRMFG